MLKETQQIGINPWTESCKKCMKECKYKNADSKTEVISVSQLKENRMYSFYVFCLHLEI